MEKLKKALYLDDRRVPTTTIPGYEPWVVVKNYDEFVEYIMINGIPDFVSFDHDLGDEHYLDYQTQVSTMGWQSPDYEAYKEKTGVSCAIFLCNHIQDELAKLVGDIPALKAFRFPTCSVHSANPVGADNIRDYINGFMKHVGLVPTCFIGDHPFITPELTIKS